VGIRFGGSKNSESEPGIPRLAGNAIRQASIGVAGLATTLLQQVMVKL